MFFNHHVGEKILSCSCFDVEGYVLYNIIYIYVYVIISWRHIPLHTRVEVRSHDPFQARFLFIDIWNKSPWILMT